MKRDNRYTVTLEYCGEEKPRYIARFCGDWLGKSETELGAFMIVQNDMDKRDPLPQPLNLPGH
jgi:hypothetical protein